jgi:hypothetical protein
MQLTENGLRFWDVLQHLREEDAVKSRVLNWDVPEIAHVVDRLVGLVDLTEVRGLVTRVREVRPVRRDPGSCVEKSGAAWKSSPSIRSEPIEVHTT